MTTENPTFDDNSPQKDDVEAAAAALREVSSEPQTVEAMEKLMEAKIEARLAQAAPTINAVEMAIAHLSEAPTNWHQSTVYFGALPSDDEDAGWGILTLLSGIPIVMCQCMVAVGMAVGTYNPSCVNSDQCQQKGTFCLMRGDGSVDRCDYCGNEVPLPRQADPKTGGTLNYPRANEKGFPPFSGYNATLVAEVCANPSDRQNADGEFYPQAGVASWCETCVSAIDMAVDPITGNGHTAANVAAMGPFDWIALYLATFVVALTVVGELKDIKLVTIAIQHAGDKLSPAWRYALTFLGGLRRWLFLVALVMAVPTLVIYKGADALSICFNTIAVLFLCEIDNITYIILLSERVRSRAEANGMRVHLNDSEARSLSRTKALHVVLITALVPTAVLMASYKANILPFCAFWFAGVVEVISDVKSAGGGIADSCIGIAKITGSTLLGMVGFVCLFLMSGGG